MSVELTLEEVEHTLTALCSNKKYGCGVCERCIKKFNDEMERLIRQKADEHENDTGPDLQV